MLFDALRFASIGFVTYCSGWIRFVSILFRFVRRGFLVWAQGRPQERGGGYERGVERGAEEGQGRLDLKFEQPPAAA